jgi:quinol monooxygenase YgiN
MNEHVFWLLELEIFPGKLDDFQALKDEMIASVNENEPGTLNYEWFISADKTQCHIYERYENSSSVMAHLGNFGGKFAERFFSASEAKKMVVYGNVSDQVRAALTEIGAEFMGPWNE